jgi:hypothetical protein
MLGAAGNKQDTKQDFAGHSGCTSLHGNSVLL